MMNPFLGLLKEPVSWRWGVTRSWKPSRRNNVGVWQAILKGNNDCYSGPCPGIYVEASAISIKVDYE